MLRLQAFSVNRIADRLGQSARRNSLDLAYAGHDEVSLHEGPSTSLNRSDGVKRALCASGFATCSRRNRSMNIDHSVYPDIEHGEDFEDDGDRADYVMRVCAAWDLGVPPERATVALFREWRSI